MERCAARARALLLIVAVSLACVSSACLSSPVSAKGHFPTRGYAVFTGPGLKHPIVFAAPWKKSRGGYYGSEAERFLGLAEGTGALPAGKLQTDAGDYVPYGVLPLDYEPSVAGFTPRYRLTWFRDGVTSVAVQDIYPYAAAGPVVYTYPSARRPLVVLFGRFQSPAHLWTGWGRATTFDLRKLLQFYGLPIVAPAAQVDQENVVSSTAPTGSPSLVAVGSVHATNQPTRVFGPAALVLVVLAVVSAIALATRRRGRNAHSVAPLDL